VPGTRTAWRELVVSELAVYGDPGAARVPLHLPHVLVGGLDGAKKAVPWTTDASTPANVGAPFSSIDAFCKDYETKTAPLFEQGKDEYPGFIEGPYCTKGDRILDGKLSAPIKELRTVRVAEWNERHRQLAIVTKRGAFIVAYSLDVDELRNPGCGGGCNYDLEGVDVVPRKDGVSASVVAVTRRHCWNNPFPMLDEDGGDIGAPGSSTYDRSALVCAVDADGAVACRSYAIGVWPAAYREFEDRWADVPWDQVKKRTTTAAGDVVFE
jgi:hypothetical protein